MAARRLIVVLVVLLAVSIAAAAIAPERSGRLAALQEKTSTPEAASRPPSSAGLVTAEIVASTEDPPTVRGAIGDRLALSVGSQRPREVEIPSLGLLDDAAEIAPARFDVLLREAGTLPIVDAASGSVIGRIVVEAPAPERAPGEGNARPGKGGAQPGRPTSGPTVEQA